MGWARKTRRELLEQIEALERRLSAQQTLDAQGPHAGDPPRAAAYQRAQEEAGAFTLEVDGRGTVTHVSASIQAVLGHAPNEVLQHGSSEWIHENDRERLFEQVAKAFSSGDSEKMSCRLHHADGSW